jgi:hypothetical protein
MRLGISDAPGKAHAPNVEETNITACLTERTQRNAAENDATRSSNARRYWQSQPGTTATTRRLAAHDAGSLAASRIAPLFATRVRSTSDAECAFSVDHMPFMFIATDENGLPSRLTTMSLTVAAYFLK